MNIVYFNYNFCYREINDKKRNHIIEKNSLKDEKERLENMLNKLELDYANTRNLKSQTLKVIEREERKIEDFKRQISDTMLVYRYIALYYN